MSGCNSVFQCMMAAFVAIQLFASVPTVAADDTVADWRVENYPAMFHIIFWLSIVLIAALWAICYAMMNMDVGEDGIIYKTTSQRKKNE
eukprot:Nk52_evm15s745 gene=Nk52_evmTU15s745